MKNDTITLMNGLSSQPYKGTRDWYPEDKAVGRAENLLVDDLRNRWPQGGRNERETDAKHHNRGESQEFAVRRRQRESEHQVADNQKQSAPDQHRSALSLRVKKPAKERSDDGGADREPPEYVRGCLGGDSIQIALEHIRAISLEREDR